MSHDKNTEMPAFAVFGPVGNRYKVLYCRTSSRMTWAQPRQQHLLLLVPDLWLILRSTAKLAINRFTTPVCSIAGASIGKIVTAAEQSGEQEDHRSPRRDCTTKFEYDRNNRLVTKP